MGITLRGLIVVMVLLLASGHPVGAQQGDPAAPHPAPVPKGEATQPDPSAGDQPLPPANAPASDQSVDAQAGELLKKLGAKQFDARLPDKPLSDWFAEQVGKRAQVEWSTGDCSGEGGGSDAAQSNDNSGGNAAVGNGGMSNSPGDTDVTLCSEAQALFYDADGKPTLDRYVVLHLWIGSRRLGVNGDPRDYGPDALSVFVFDGTSTRTLNRLGDLPGVLATIN
jgi:hypothetical protein